MKYKRIIVRGLGVYHVFNRTAYSRYTLEDREREMFVTMMRKQAAFCGVEVLSYCVLSNHYHMLVRIRECDAINDSELLRRYRMLYQDTPPPRAAMRPNDLEAVLSENGPEAAKIRIQLRNRMHCLPVFMKELQQRFGIWYNATHGNKGTLWSERYRSVLVEHNPRIMRIVAAYIELNPVRACLVERPEVYRWSSLSAALRNDTIAQAGICAVTGYRNDYNRALEIYIRHIYSVGDHPRTPEGQPLGSKQSGKGNALKSADEYNSSVLLDRISAFTRGIIIGTAEFLKDFRGNLADSFGFRLSQHAGTHRIAGNLSRQSVDLCSLRRVTK